MKKRISIFIIAFWMVMPSTFAATIAERIHSYGAKHPVNRIYKSNKYQNLWVKDGNLTNCGQIVVDRLRAADQHGLNPRDYEVVLDVNDAQNTDISITRALIRYIDDVRNGRFNPKLADHNLAMKPASVDPAHIITEGLRSGSCNWIDRQPPQYPEYENLKETLKGMRVLKAQGPWPNLGEEKLEYEDKNPEIIKLRQILTRLGYLDPQFDNGSDIFDADLDLAVRTFQKYHGLSMDGVVGDNTSRALNKTPDDRIRQVEIVLERWRWMPHTPPERYIRVNIPAFSLVAVENNKVVLRSPIIVGRAYRKTPVFTAPLVDIKFNPSWHIPKNLLHQDTIPKLRKDPSYATRKGFIIHRNGAQVSPHDVDWSAAGPNNISIRQAPGDSNALGKIRFSIDNPYNIFLHGTPEQHLFDFPVRTFSSGCIRVLKVVELARFVFNDPHSWSKERIEREMEGTKTLRVPLAKPMQINVIYMTVWRDEDGHTHFVNDIYNQDKKVWEALQRIDKS